MASKLMWFMLLWVLGVCVVAGVAQFIRVMVM